MKTVASLRTGQKGIITGFDNSGLSLKFLEMGCIPGNEIEVCCKAPLGSPYCVRVSGYHLALRKDEAAQIFISE